MRGNFGKKKKKKEVESISGVVRKRKQQMCRQENGHFITWHILHCIHFFYLLRNVLSSRLVVLLHFCSQQNI